MASTASPPRVTPDDLLKMPDGDHFELVDGQLVEDRMSNESAWICLEIASLLREYARVDGRGVAFADGLQLRCFPDDSDRIRKPDACYFSAARFKPDLFPQGYCPIAPELVVEVVSPHDAYYEVERKVYEYLDAGVLLIWVISPESRTIVAYDRSGRIDHLTSSQTLTGNDVLPGFQCRVDSLFPPHRS
ncbi:Uma2 family endonuclease [Planctomyces sp. SH-PL14]|uniref:Uma2 family endonuclease n=1 Tax=Planctomyces sp. SH-PL14 TaxID=1632864 RepID=UPI00078DB5D2|nr:Uma2 family endonuclease [Planctomyces sp. SH-PL14]AMV21125.1 hypothetical protein VT03_24700 [Planctomyces sp. SH-PL14]